SHPSSVLLAPRSGSPGAVPASGRVQTRSRRERLRSPRSTATGRTGWASAAWATSPARRWSQPQHCSATWGGPRSLGSSGTRNTSTSRSSQEIELTSGRGGRRNQPYTRVQMAYVIVQPCIGVKDASCVEVCPVDCIHTSDGDPMYYIDPDECIDCGAC